MGDWASGDLCSCGGVPRPGLGHAFAYGGLHSGCIASCGCGVLCGPTAVALLTLSAAGASSFAPGPVLRWPSRPLSAAAPLSVMKNVDSPCLSRGSCPMPAFVDPDTIRSSTSCKSRAHVVFFDSSPWSTRLCDLHHDVGRVCKPM